MSNFSEKSKFEHSNDRQVMGKNLSISHSVTNSSTTWEQEEPADISSSMRATPQKFNLLLQRNKELGETDHCLCLSRPDSLRMSVSNARETRVAHPRGTKQEFSAMKAFLGIGITLTRDISSCTSHLNFLLLQWCGGCASPTRRKRLCLAGSGAASVLPGSSFARHGENCSDQAISSSGVLVRSATGRFAG